MSEYLAVDTETKGLAWFDPDEQAFMVSWAWDGGSDVAWIEDAAGLERFRERLDVARVIVMHNAPFDCHQLRETLGIDLLSLGKTIIDTNELARVVLPERRFGEDAGYKLKNLAQTYVSRDSQDAEAAIEELAKAAGIKLKATGGYYDTGRAYPAEMEHYAKVDTEITLALYHKLIPKVDDTRRRTWELEHALQPVLIAAEARGVAIDESKVGPLKEQYEAVAAETFERLTNVLGADALEGTDALKDALLEHGVPLHRTTPTGELATNKFALQEHEADFPILRDLSEWRTATKFLSTYIAPLEGRAVVHPNFHQQGAWTGRMSCSRPNLQNIPVRAGSEVREVFIPREGCCFIVHDYDSIELKLLAYYLNDDGFKQQVRDGVDVFAELAARVYGPSGPLADGSSGDPADYRKGTAGADLRGNCKNVVYAITYGAGKARITDMLDLDPLGIVDGRGGKYPANHVMVSKGWAQEGAPMHEPANVVVKLVKSWLPNYHRLNKRVRNKIESTGYVTTLMGRKQPVNRDKSYVGLNALIQGSAADIFKQGAISAARELKHVGFRPVLFVHDELVSEGPIENAKEAAAVQADCMRCAFELDPPLDVSGGIVHTNYAEAK